MFLSSNTLLFDVEEEEVKEDETLFNDSTFSKR